MLAPVLVRGTKGSDVDCAELLLVLTAKGCHPAIADPPCGACRAAGKTCIVPAKVVDAWLSPIVFAVGRCVECTLTGKVCPLISQTHISVCTCNWMIPPAHRPLISKHVQMSMQSAWERCKPRRMRHGYPDMALAPHLRKWIGQKLSTSVVQSVSTGDKEYICDLLGREVYREDGRWIRPPKDQWTTCVCMPDECVPLRHEFNDSESECPTLSSITCTEVGSEGGFKGGVAEVLEASLVTLTPVEVLVEEGRCCGF